MTTGLVTGVAVGLIYGGLSSIQHLVLRLLLWHSGAMPWNYARFLDEAAEYLLLRKVGGRYIFVHRLLLEHLAGRVIAPGDHIDAPLIPVPPQKSSTSNAEQGCVRPDPVFFRSTSYV